MRIYLGLGNLDNGGLWAGGAAAARGSNSAFSGWLFEGVHFLGAGVGRVRPPGGAFEMSSLVDSEVWVAVERKLQNI